MNRRLVMTALDELVMQQQEVPTPPLRGAVVKICYSGLCHSDVHLYHDPGTLKPAAMPRVLGHEISGILHSVGEEFVKESPQLQVGDRVVAYSWGGCQECPMCEGGEYMLCTNKETPQAGMFGVWSDGGFQEYVIVDRAFRLLKLEGGTDMATICLAPCSGITAYNAIQKCEDSIKTAIKCKGSANVLINGAGGVGLWAIEMVKVIYGEKVVLCVTDIVEEKLEDAKTKGADKTLLLPRDGDDMEMSGRIKMTFAGGVNAAIDFVNLPSTQRRLFYALDQGATQVFVGLFGREMAELSTTKMVLAQCNLRGCYAGSREQLQIVVDMIQKKQISGPPITKITLDDVENRLKEMLKGSPNRGRYVAEICKS